MGCASSTPLTQGAGSPEVPAYDLRQADTDVAGKVRQTVTGMADAVPVQDMIDGVSHVKDEALHKLHDFGETMKDKVESVVEDVEETIGSAFGAAKNKTNEKMEDAKEAFDSMEEKLEETKEKTMEEVDKEVDTMVEDLEESLPPPPRPESQSKDFQMGALGVRRGSQVSTAQLSRKSGDGGIEIKEDHNGGEESVTQDDLEIGKKVEPNNEEGSNSKTLDEVNTESVKESGNNLPQSGSRKSSLKIGEEAGGSLLRQASVVSNKKEAEETLIEPETPVAAIPFGTEESPKTESENKEDKEKKARTLSRQASVMSNKKETEETLIEPETPVAAIPFGTEESPKTESENKEKETGTLSRQASVVSNKKDSKETLIEPETATPVAAIPFGTEESPKTESENKEDKEKEGKSSSLSVELPPEGKDESVSTTAEEPQNTRPDSEAHHHTPTPIPPPADNMPTMQSTDNEGTPAVIEAPIEATIIAPQESVVNAADISVQNDATEARKLSASLDGKNDSAISSSGSVTPEEEQSEPHVEERQSTPIIEVA